MSRPSQGSYIIYNRVLSPTGDKLAITFMGQNNTLTVTPKTNSSAQIWKLTNSSTNTMTVVPQDSTSLQVGWGDAGAVAIPAGAYVWTIKGSDSGYTIQDGGVTQNWHLDKANNNALVAIAPDQGTERYRWIFEAVN